MALSTTVDSGLFDSLPSIRRPMAWENSARTRQMTSDTYSDSDSTDEYLARISTAPARRTVRSSASSPVLGGRRTVIEVLVWVNVRFTVVTLWIALGFGLGIGLDLELG